MTVTDAAPTQRLTDAFARGRAENRALLMPFLVCGHPDPDTFVAVARAAASAGADLFEIGIPFSDPIMDGPVIAAASNEVLARGQRFADALSLIERVTSDTGVPVLAMTYYNLLFHRGLERTARDLASAGACGTIVPDLSVEDSVEWRAACASTGIAPVFIASQTSPPQRLRALADASRGFVYAASLLGVTGLRSSLSDRARTLVDDLRAVTQLPVAVGIGVSNAEQAKTAAQYADGVIVGSAIVDAVSTAQDPATAVAALVAELRVACARV